MDRILISVIVPVYGAEKYLNKCVRSILAQTYEQLEIILVDDGSRDRSGAMCDEYAVRDRRVRVLHQENGGLMSAWMAGTKCSKGAYLCYVDSDDWIEPDMIKALADNMTRVSDYVGAEIICSNFVIDRGDGTPVQPRAHVAKHGEYSGEILQREIKQKILGNENRTVSLSRCMKLFSRDLILGNIHFCDQSIRMGEDVNIVLPAVLDCKRLVILKDHYDYHYYYNPASMVHAYDTQLADNVRKLLQIIGEILQEKKAQLGNADLQAMQSREYVFLFCLVLKNELRSGRKKAAAQATLLCRQEELKEQLRKYPVQAGDKVNRLLILLMKHPLTGYAYILTLLFQLAGRRKV